MSATPSPAPAGWWSVATRGTSGRLLTGRHAHRVLRNRRHIRGAAGRQRQSGEVPGRAAYTSSPGGKKNRKLDADSRHLAVIEKKTLSRATSVYSNDRSQRLVRATANGGRRERKNPIPPRTVRPMRRRYLGFAPRWTGEVWPVRDGRGRDGPPAALGSSAGRSRGSCSTQLVCLFAGRNRIFYQRAVHNEEAAATDFPDDRCCKLWVMNADGTGARELAGGTRPIAGMAG